MKIGPLHIPTYRLFIHLTVIACFIFGCFRSRTISEVFIFNLGIGTFGFGTASGAAAFAGDLEHAAFDIDYQIRPIAPSNIAPFIIGHIIRGRYIEVIIGWPYIIITYAIASITYAIIRVKRNHLSQRTDPT